LIGGAFTRENALTIWPLVEPLVQRATEKDFGRSSTDTIKELIEQDKAVLWADNDLKIGRGHA